MHADHAGSGSGEGYSEEVSGALGAGPAGAGAASGRVEWTVAGGGVDGEDDADAAKGGNVQARGAYVVRPAVDDCFGSCVCMCGVGVVGWWVVPV